MVALGGNPLERELLGDGIGREPAVYIHRQDTLHQCRFLFIDVVARTSVLKLLIDIPEWNIATRNEASLRTAAQAAPGPFSNPRMLILRNDPFHIGEQLGFWGLVAHWHRCHMQSHSTLFKFFGQQ